VHPDLLVGTSTGDDAAVWRVSEHRALVSTLDFFTPLVDDARTWGAIAAANAVSDVYAMGGQPLFALTIAAWPRDVLPLDLLGEALAGAAETAMAGGWMVVGGHTVDGPEPMLGQAVTGEVDPRKMFTNDAGRAGEVLVLTKALGTGVVATAIKRSTRADGASGFLAASASSAIASMTKLNAAAAHVARDASLRCVTDVTGFGLAGHLHKLALASGVAAVIERAHLPVLPGIADLIDAGFVPGGTGRNLEFVRDHLDVATSCAPGTHELVADPQTSGGLLLCVPASQLSDVCAALRARGELAAVIGELTTGSPGQISVR
jgi:selenide, water dikinase